MRNIRGKIGDGTPFFNKVRISTNGLNNYSFKYNGRKYPFSLFSDDFELQKVDKEILKHVDLRQEERIFRPLKLVFSMNLVSPKIVMGKSVGESLKALILYQEAGLDKIIDYSRNLVMTKEDYYEMFNFQEMNVVNRVELYNIDNVLKKIGDCKQSYKYFLYTKEMFSDLSRKDGFEFLTQKYDNNGFHMHNNILFETDDIFTLDRDFCNAKYEKVRLDLRIFTENPQKEQNNIECDKNKGVYIFRNEEFEDFTFSLLSDLTDDKQIKEELLSDKRYHHCHSNSLILASSLDNSDRTSTYIVGGKTKANEIDYSFHSWVEIEKENIVLDYNYNLIMDKDKYYKLFGAVAISKTLISEMKEVIQTVVYDAGFNLTPMDVNYFGVEMMRDLKKNNKILYKRKD